jgi:outer membrane protein OmpA-like peptidoglycan-associated protein/tetratricopeptide (TPR) repeat protein
MKIIFSFLVCFLVFFNVVAQSNLTYKADKSFTNLSYVDAINQYLEVIKKSGENNYIQVQLAESYYNIFSTVEAEKWFAKVVKTNKNKEYYFKYAQMLKANGHLEEANKWLKKFSDIAPNDLRAIAHKKLKSTGGKILSGTSKFKVSVIPNFNTKFAEFGPLLHDGKLYYCSARSNNIKKYGWNEEPFLDIYTSNFDTILKTLSNETVLVGKVNTNKNEGTVSFSRDGKKMYFSGESLNRYAGFFNKKFKKDNTGKSTINIYSATLKDSLWTDIEVLPFNVANYNTSGPAVSLDGKRLYFSSDMKGTLGGSDLWYVTINNNGTYGNPINLGKGINTEGTEMFPYISSKNILYFSSNGHPGYGMLDVFASQIKDNSFGSLRNLGESLNSRKDDFSFTINEKSEKGFFASNRDGGVGSDDIYIFDKLSPICDVNLHLQIIDANSKNVLPFTKVAIYNSNNNMITEKTTDKNGKVSFNYECNQFFKIEANKEMYTIGTLNVAMTDSVQVKKTLALTPIIIDDQVVLNPIFFDLDKHNITAQGAKELNKLLTVMKKYPKMIIKAYSHTDSRANDTYNIALSNRRAKATVQYIISKGINPARISGEGKGETELTNKCSNGVLCSKEAHQANRRSEFIIVNSETYK